MGSDFGEKRVERHVHFDTNPDGSYEIEFDPADGCHRSTPSTCTLCRGEFMRRPMLQFEARHLAAIQGDGYARWWVDEVLSDFHACHSGGNSNADQG